MAADPGRLQNVLSALLYYGRTDGLPRLHRTHILRQRTADPADAPIYRNISGAKTFLAQINSTYFMQEDNFDKDANMTLDHFQNNIQRQIIYWNQYRLIANMPTAMFMNTYLGRFLPLFGNKIPKIARCMGRSKRSSTEHPFGYRRTHDRLHICPVDTLLVDR